MSLPTVHLFLKNIGLISIHLGHFNMTLIFCCVI